MQRTFTIVAALAVLLSPPIRAQDGEELPCEGLLAAPPERLAEVLGQVPKYGSTYVIVSGEGFGEVEGLDSPALQQSSVAVYQGSPAAAMVERAGLGVETYVFDDAGKIIDDMLAGNAVAAVLWAPLAGLGALELDFNYELSFRTAGAPAPPPSALQSLTVASSGATDSGAAESGAACAEEVRGLLEGYGVVPAEKLVPLDIRELLHLPAPPRDLAAAATSAPLYAEHCAKCHGPEAVAATDALAPVDLLVSVRRFTYPGFLYIVLNGRSQNGMPGFRGSLTRELVEQIYQYVRERSHGALAATGAPDLADNAGVPPVSGGAP